MPKSTTTCNRFLALLYNAAAWANVADNAATGPLTNVPVSLHTASPGNGNDQTTNESAYTNYTRTNVARTTAGWSSPSGGQAGNVALLQFPQCGATGSTVSHVATGTALSGVGNVWHHGALNAPIAVSNGIQPQFAPNALVVQET